MIKMKHNKKRNVGVVYEQLLNYIAKNVVNDKQNVAKKAVKIIERRFNKNTELYKEFRLFNALANTDSVSTEVAAGILVEAKKAARRINKDKLRNEKSLLIKDINYQLKENNFFHNKIDNYRDYASIQILINEWCKEDKSDLRKLVEYEKMIIESLVATKSDKVINNDLEYSDKLVFKIMAEKINKKYNQKLSNEQKDIIKHYAIYQDSPNLMQNYLSEVKQKTLSQLKDYQEGLNNQVLLTKIDRVYDNVENLSVTDISESNIKKFLTITSLKEELKKGL
jgi:hypothetical protein